MARYFLDNKPQDNGDYEVQKLACLAMPLPRYSHYSRGFKTTEVSVKEAKKYRKQVTSYYYFTYPWHVNQNNPAIEYLSKS